MQNSQWNCYYTFLQPCSNKNCNMTNEWPISCFPYSTFIQHYYVNFILIKWTHFLSFSLHHCLTSSLIPLIVTTLNGLTRPEHYCCQRFRYLVPSHMLQKYHWLHLFNEHFSCSYRNWFKARLKDISVVTVWLAVVFGINKTPRVEIFSYNNLVSYKVASYKVDNTMDLQCIPCIKLVKWL